MAGHELLQERELLLQIAEGDERAFYSLYSHYAPMIRTYILKMSRSAEDTSEIVQETFIRVWLNRDQLPEMQKFSSWLNTIAARLCLNFLEKQANRNRINATLQPQASLNSPEETLSITEIRKAVHQALQQMPANRQAIYRMNREQGLKPAAIAEQLNMPVGSVKNHLTTAIKSIRTHLATLGHVITTLICLCLHLF